MSENEESFEKNISRLEKQLKYTGMPTELNTELQNAMKSGVDKFALTFSKDINKDKVVATLNFEKSKLENYFFNSYDLTLLKENKPAISRNFKVEYGKTYTLKEGYNLMDGRSVNKTYTTLDKDTNEAKTTNSWNYPDFKNTNSKGEFLIRQRKNFKLEPMLEKLNLINYNIPQVRLDIVGNLNKGNYATALKDVNGKEERIILEADPKYDNIKVYNSKMEEIHLSNKTVIENTLAQTNDLGAKQVTGPEPKNTSETVAAQSNSNKPSVEVAATNKKTAANKKGNKNTPVEGTRPKRTRSVG